MNIDGWGVIIIKKKGVDRMINEINDLLQEAVKSGFLVSIRITDMPYMSVDSTITTKITKAYFDEESKNLHLEAPYFTLKMQYTTVTMGTESGRHSKFYIKSDGATLTITIEM